MWEENLSKYVQDKDVLAATVQYLRQWRVPGCHLLDREAGG